MIREGRRVTHKKFGVGTIVSNEAGYVKVNFEEIRKELKFKSDDFGNWFQEFQDPQTLLSLLEEQGFEGFHHYTDFSNFIKIMREGKLYSREKAQKKGLLLTDGAEGTIIAKTSEFVKSKVRFYYKEHTPTLYQNEGIRHLDDFKRDEEQWHYLAHMPIPVLLLFKKDLIFESDVCFSNGGCGNRHTEITTDLKEACCYDWQGIFERGSYGIVPPPIKWEISNRRNAEFLVPNEVNINKLQAVIFRTEADKKHAEFILGKNDIFQVDSNKFTITFFEDKKRNCLRNYSVIEAGIKRQVELEFLKVPTNYSHSLKQYFRDGRVVEENFCFDNRFVVFTYDAEEGTEKIEYLLNNIVSAVWR